MLIAQDATLGDGTKVLLKPTGAAGLGAGFGAGALAGLMLGRVFRHRSRHKK